jgi:SAM-dependent methyltransferase
VLADHFADLIAPGHSVLDIGCGDGLIDRLILARRADLQIAGVDVMVRPNSHIPVTTFDGRRLPFPDRSWDTVLLCDVLHHTERPVELLREASRVGRHAIVIKDHTVAGILARPTLRVMDVVGNVPHGVAVTYNYLTPGQWQDAFHAAGLIPRDVRRALRLYPWWAEPIVGRSLHFVAVCDIQGDAPP